VQSFGNLCLDEKLTDLFVQDLCAVFDVSTLADLVGKTCYVLYSFPYWNEPIEGLETEHGRRFTLTYWRKKHFPKSLDPLTAQKESLRHRIQWAEQEAARAKKALTEVAADFVDWEKS